MKYSLLLFFLFILAGSISCKKDQLDTNTSVPLNPKVEMLTGTSQKLWGFASATKNGDDALADCQKDNLILYKTNMTVVVDEGALKCVSSAPQNTTSAWKFNTGEDSIVYATSGGVTESYKIDFISANELKLSTTDTIPGTDSVLVYRVTFKPL